MYAYYGISNVYMYISFHYFALTFLHIPISHHAFLIFAGVGGGKERTLLLYVATHSQLHIIIVNAIHNIIIVLR